MISQSFSDLYHWLSDHELVPKFILTSQLYEYTACKMKTNTPVIHLSFGAYNIINRIRVLFYVPQWIQLVIGKIATNLICRKRLLEVSGVEFR
jgi:hypothetical protein